MSANPSSGSSGTALSGLRQAEGLTARLPPLMVAARHLANTVQLGDHGRRRAGQGDAFWQFRTAGPGDPAHRIDWRRSARSDQAFIRDREWQAAQTVWIWIDPARSMAFGSRPDHPTKEDRARVLALAAALLFLRAGERVGFLGAHRPPMQNEAALPDRMAEIAMAPKTPEGFSRRARAVILSDGLAAPDRYLSALARAAQARVKGVFVQVLDPAEERFPFAGRSLFLDMQDRARFETREADDLRAPYLARLAERKSELARACRQAGWAYHCHDTLDAPAGVLLWLYRALEGGR